MIAPVSHIAVFASILFLIGFYGVLSRRNVVGILIAIEIMLNAVNVNFIAFSRMLNLSAETAQIFVIFIIVLAALTAAVALAIVISVYRNRKTTYLDEIDLLKW